MGLRQKRRSGYQVSGSRGGQGIKPSSPVCWLTCLLFKNSFALFPLKEKSLFFSRSAMFCSVCNRLSSSSWFLQIFSCQCLPDLQACLGIYSASQKMVAATFINLGHFKNTVTLFCHQFVKGR